jgi:formylglycine-generating enzyme required for sulfatase activity/serine/threonine protein phosphatase PrpC
MSSSTPVRLPHVTRTVRSRRSWRWLGGLKAGYASEAGGRHGCNQDSCTHAPSAERPGFCGVADGVGGGAHGEIASSVLLSHCADAPKATYRNPDRLAEWVIQGDARVAEAIARRTSQAGAATLAAAWFPTQGTAHLVSVGDCRVYRLSPGKQRYSIRRVTEDQTYANVAEAPPLNGRPNDPARMVGAGAVGVPAVVKTEIRDGELLLLCSDGVHKFVRDEQIANVVSDGLGDGRSLETICGTLVRTAKSNGSHDDASALLVLRRPWLAPRWAYAFALVALLILTLGAQKALAETQSVIDPTEAAEPPATSPAPRKAKKTAPPESDAALKRERQRVEEESRRRTSAEARAQAAENEAAKLRAAEQARHAEAAKEAAKAAAARKAAQARAAAAAKATRSLIAAEHAAAEAAARDAAARELAARQAAEREAVAREAAVKEAIAKEAAAKEAAAREVAAREAAAREIAAKDAAAREFAAREARSLAAKQAASRDITTVKLAAMQSPARDFFTSRSLQSLGTAFRDCADCPELVWLPQGEFLMGEPSGANGRHSVRIGYTLAVGKFEVTFAEWDACVASGGCRKRPDDAGWGRGRQPVVNVTWEDAQQYAAWLSRKTRKNYRLLTEAEWEYAARAGSHVRFWWGNEAGQGDANCTGCGSQWDGRRAAPVGSFVPNPFGLHDMHGNVSEWVEDCYHDRYYGAPGDGSAWTQACTTAVDIRMVRGGAWRDASHATRSAARWSASSRYYDNRIGFRIARTD